MSSARLILLVFVTQAWIEMLAFHHSNWDISNGRISPRDLQQQVNFIANLYKLDEEEYIFHLLVNLINLTL